MTEIAYPRMLSIAGLHKSYLMKEITPEAVVREIIRRAGEDSELNIWIVPPAMEAIKPYLDRLATLDPFNCPLWGIPFAIKDNIDLAGVPTTAGCPEYAYTPDKNAEVVERLIAAGAIPLGKTNMDQFATGLVGTRSPYGETHNAVRQELISGGSSSGSAVAVARGQAAFALGTDTAGSGRVPAALNGLVGYKPSLGAWPTTGVVPACASLDCVTVFAHDLEEVMLVDGVARGVDTTDPWSRSMPQPTPKLPAKICLPQQDLDFFGPLAEEYSEAWKDTVESCKRLNIPIEYLDYSLFAQAAAILYEGPFVAERWADLGAFINTHPGAAFPVTDQILRSGDDPRHTAAAVFESIHRLQLFRLEARKLLSDAVLLLPTTGGTWTREQVGADPIGTNSALGRFTNHCNLLDLCAVAIPAGSAAPNTPFGITLFALAENEALIYGLAKLIMDTGRTTSVAVCGLHMRGYPLEHQMRDYGAWFVREALTAPKYQMVRLPTVPAKPGLIRHSEGGGSIYLEIWEMPLENFGSFVTSIPAPLGIGQVELQDGTFVPGFICEACAVAGAEDITACRSWRNI